MDDSKEEISRSPRENTARSPLVKTGAEQKTEVDSDQQIESNQLLITSLADIIRRRSFKIHQLGWKDDGIKMVSVGIFVISKKVGCAYTRPFLVFFPQALAPRDG